MTRVLIAGVSTRAAASSAVRAGFEVTSVDAFADYDQPASARVIRVPRFTVPAAARVARGVPCDAVTYLSSFENHREAVATLTRGRALWGNPPAVLARVREPREIVRVLSARGFTVPVVCLRAQGDAEEAVARQASRWIVKPFASGGGHRVRRWRIGMRVPASCYIQEFVEGTPGSIVFVAARGRAVPLGVTQQLVGQRAFGAGGFRYCGSILAPAGSVRATELARAVAEEFSLTGLNGVDFIDREGEPVPIEVNPRWCGSMELVERAHGLSLFGLHAAACARGELPSSAPPPVTEVHGKAVVFARGPVEVPDTTAWLGDPSVADVPHPGERIDAGRPVCTVFATAPSVAECFDALVTRAGQVYAAGARPAGVLA